MTASPGQHEAAGIEAVLREHDWFTPRGYAFPCCLCGVEFQGGEDEAYAHVAAALREHLMSAAVVEAAEVLRVEAERRVVEGDSTSGYVHSRVSRAALRDRAAALAAALSAPPAPSKAVDGP